MSVRFLVVVAAIASTGVVACGDDTGGGGGSGGAGTGGASATGSDAGVTTGGMTTGSTGSGGDDTTSATGTGGTTTTSTGSGGDDTTSATGTGGGEVGPCNDICNTTEEVEQSVACTDCATAATLGGDCATEGTACLAAVEGEGDTLDCCPCGAFLQGICTSNGFGEELCESSETPYGDLNACVCEVCS